MPHVRAMARLALFSWPSNDIRAEPSPVDFTQRMQPTISSLTTSKKPAVDYSRFLIALGMVIWPLLVILTVSVIMIYDFIFKLHYFITK